MIVVRDILSSFEKMSVALVLTNMLSCRKTTNARQSIEAVEVRKTPRLDFHSNDSNARRVGGFSQLSRPHLSKIGRYDACRPKTGILSLIFFI